MRCSGAAAAHQPRMKQRHSAGRADRGFSRADHARGASLSPHDETSGPREMQKQISSVQHCMHSTAHAHAELPHTRRACPRGLHAANPCCSCTAQRLRRQASMLLLSLPPRPLQLLLRRPLQQHTQPASQRESGITGVQLQVRANLSCTSPHVRPPRPHPHATSMCVCCHNSLQIG
jgi:hypothetical protein